MVIGQASPVLHTHTQLCINCISVIHLCLCLSLSYVSLSHRTQSNKGEGEEGCFFLENPRKILNRLLVNLLYYLGVWAVRKKKGVMDMVLLWILIWVLCVNSNDGEFICLMLFVVYAFVVFTLQLKFWNCYEILINSRNLCNWVIQLSLTCCCFYF